MSISETSAPLSTDDIERPFLSLDRKVNKDGAEPIPPVEEYLRRLMVLNECGESVKRDQCSMVLQQYLVDGHDFEGLLKLLKLRTEWLGDPLAYGEECHDILVSATKDRMIFAKVESVNFGKDRPFTCLKRLEMLCSLVPGATCYDKTWGYGVVKSQDDFYKRMVVDFERKPSHAMAFSYAGQSLKRIDAKHILAIRHENVEAFNEKCAKKAGEIVALAFNSFGPMSVARLEDELTHGILPPSVEWKNFWTQARTQLKKDARFKLPPASKKNDVIEFAEAVRKPGDENWFQEISGLNDVPELITKIAAFALTSAGSDLGDEFRGILQDRLSYVLKACATTHNEKDKVRTIMLAVKLGFKELPVAMRSRHSDEFTMTSENSIDLLATLCNPQIVLSAASRLQASLMVDLVSLIPLSSNLDVARAYLDVLHEMPYNLLEDVAPVVMNGVAATEFNDKVRAEFSQIDVPFPLLLWLCRNQDDNAVKAILPSAVVATQALLSLEFEVMGENLRLQHHIARLFRDEKWLRNQIDRMTEIERASTFERIRAVEGAWEPLQKRAIEKFLLKSYPDLSVPETESESGSGVPVIDHTTTSWRSLNERKEKYRLLIEEEMPNNVKEIEVARSYGDLRENFEYQSAKDHQRILLQRQSEMDLEIKGMRGTDFSAVEFKGIVIVGSEVTLMHADSHSDTYHILGEWDSDLALGILPSHSRLARILIGHVVGDKVMIPNEDGGEVEVTVTSVQPLSRTILDWASGR